jgi:hypothetical protein
MSSLKNHHHTQQADDSSQSIDTRISRFFLALLLRQIIEEEPLDQGLAGLIQLEIGKAQALQRSAFDLCGKVIAFCKTLGFNSVATMLKPLRNRLQFGTKKELLPLKPLSIVATPSLLRCFYEAGFKTLKSFLKKDSRNFLLDILARRRQNHYVRQEDEGKCKGLASKDNELLQKILHIANEDVYQKLRHPVVKQ